MPPKCGYIYNPIHSSRTSLFTEREGDIVRVFDQRSGDGGGEEIKIQKNLCILRQQFWQETKLSRSCCWVGKRTGNHTHTSIHHHHHQHQHHIKLPLMNQLKPSSPKKNKFITMPHYQPMPFSSSFTHQNLPQIQIPLFSLH